MTPPVLTLGRLNDAPRVRHAFFTREGGVSDGVHASLNCGPGSADAPASVAENRRRAAAALGLDGNALVTVHQAHTAEAVVVDTPFAHADAPEADAVVTARRGIAVGVLTADCAPVLLADPEAPVVAAAHAGWRGAVNGILEAALDALEGAGGARHRVLAGVGPCIAQRSYEVGGDVAGAVTARDADDSRFLAPSPGGRWLFDLAGYAARRLAAAGVAWVDRVPADTRAEADRFFSYRRARLAGEPDYGRQLSAIALEP